MLTVQNNFGSQMTPQQQVLEKTRQCLALATKLYGIDTSKVQIRFDLKGRAAGMASCVKGIYIIRYNFDMLHREAFDHVLNNTVPHEVAHIICFMNPALGSDHNSGWERVCIALGGNGNRCHKEEIVYGKGLTYEYKTTTGHPIRFSQTVHRRIQSGKSSYTVRDKGEINKSCSYTIVGARGRTLNQPVVPKFTAPVQPVPEQKTVVQPFVSRPAPSSRTESKADIARRIMIEGYRGGKGYEQIIQEIQLATGHDRQLSRAYFKNNIVRLNIPANFIQ